MTFGDAAGRRLLPGLGSSVRPSMLAELLVHATVIVEEKSVRGCHRLASKGFAWGASTGTVVRGAMSWLSRYETPGLAPVATGSDMEESCLGILHETNWVPEMHGEDVLAHSDDELAVGPRWT
jgi:cysteine synthase A